MKTTSAKADGDSRTLRLTRIMPATLGAVWSAWTDPVRLPRWWGPRGFRCVTHEIDLRQGGEWRFDMIAPDGTTHSNRHRFTRIEPQDAIDYDLDDDGTGAFHARVQVRFQAVPSGTQVALTMTFADAQTRRDAEESGAVALGYTTLDCLAETAVDGHAVSLTRLLPVSLERLWPVLTQGRHLREWFFPAGVEIQSTDFDPLTGGDWRTAMRTTEGDSFVLRGRFGTIEAPHLLTFTHGWEGEDGNVATFTNVTLTLDPLGGGTRLVLMQTGLSSPDSAAGHREGWGQTLDHLTRHLDLT